VNAGQNPPLVYRRNGTFERLAVTGVALGMFDGATYRAVHTSIDPGEMLIMYSDGITEAENPAGQPFEEPGLQGVVVHHRTAPPAQLGVHILEAVEAHAQAPRFADDLTVLILKRAGLTPPSV
jgi:sigma-B regulation protein RsbU (phosphoserine phosphatase)